MKERFQNLVRMLSFRSMWEDQEEDAWEDYDLKENYISGEDYADDTKERAGLGSGIVYLSIILLVVIAIIAYQIMSRHHLYTEYEITDSYEAEDIAGTRYEKLGSGFVKYGSDGVTYVNGKNEVQWSAAYSIETPTVDICSETMLIFEQQGYTVEIIDRTGVLGTFQTDLPILKGVIAKNGVTALMMKDGDNVRIRIMGTDGTSLAEVKTTLEDQGQPLDMAISSDAQNMIVSMAKIGAGSVDSVIAFYNFSSAAKKSETHLVATYEFTDQVFPSVCYATDKTSAAVGDSGFVVFSGTESPKQQKTVSLTGEILSTFHDESHIGVVMASDSVTDRYRMEVYTYAGKKTADVSFAHGYTQARMDSGEILMYDTGHMMVFTPGGVERFDCDYEKQIGSFVKIPGFRRYAVLTNTGMDRIRIQ